MAIKRKHFIILGIVLCLLILLTIVRTTLSTQSSEKFYELKQGKFEATLMCKGEINGLVSTPIKVPKILGDRDLRLWDLKILDLCLDGKYVKKGDFIIQLDASTIMSGMREERQNFEKEEADLKNAKIDSAVTLSQMREEIKNAKLDLEYNKIDLEQSIYESAAYQRKAQMTYKKAENNINKKQRDYQLEQNKLKMRVGRSSEKVDRSQKKIDKFKQAMQAARITAPEDGIVIFGKSWDGKKYSKDGMVGTWMHGPPIATLPDMSKVISETYVKEIDISKIKEDDLVKVTFDALDGVEIKGKIKSIARVGEDHKDFDMKVFKVVIYLDQTHDELKPAMTSNNNIVLADLDDALYIPLNSVYKENNNTYVYLKDVDDNHKQVIETGLANEEFILVQSGLKEGDIILLSPPKEK
jgi:multidrug efflux pump subunit AcrA (membrane-fusion protein)